MTAKLPSILRPLLRRKPIVSAAAVVVLSVGLWALVSTSRDNGPAAAEAFHKVARGPFTIALTTGGSLEAVNQVSVRNLVPGRTQIISLIKEGTVVNEGDLLVELDSSDIESQLSQAEISYQQSLSAVAEQDEKHDGLISDNVIKLSDAELAVELAETDLQKYVEGQLPQLRKKAESAINLATEELRRAKDRLAGTRRLEEKGYATSSELVADQLVVTRREIELQSAQEDRRLLIEFDAPRMLRQLESGLENAKIRLDRTIRHNETQLEKARMQLASSKETLELRERKMEELRSAQKYTRIYAPQSGLVVYQKSSHWRTESVEEGASVRERQELLSLPDVSQMKVKVNIYENQISIVKPGMRAQVSLDALPDQTFRGEVISIASMPEPARDGNPNYRVYKAEVLIIDEMPEIKPGITARVDVLIAELDDVIKVPIQSVVGSGDRQFCFIRRDGKQVSVEVEVGLFDNDFVEIRNGLSSGDLVSVTPPRARDILPPEEAAPAAAPLEKPSAAPELLSTASR